MADTIVDSLVVTLGLDSSGFKKGQADARKGIKDTESVIKESAGAMASAISRVALEFVGLFLAVRGVGDIVHLFTDLNSSLRKLGFDSRNFGIAAGELRDWQEVAELAGGSAEDATKSIESLQASIFNLRFKGQVSDQIEGLQRLGVNAMTTAGQMRPFKDVLLDTATALDRTHWDDATKFQYLTQYLHLSGGIANAMVQGRKATEGYLRTAEKSEQVNKRNTDAAQALGVSWINLKYSVAGAAAQILTNLTPSIKGLIDHLALITPEKLDEFAGWIKGDGGSSITSFFSGLNSTITGLNTAVEFLGATWKATFGPDSTLAAANDWLLAHGIGSGPPINATRGERNNNPLNLKATGDQPRDAQGFAIFGSPGEGFAAASSELKRYASRGINTIRGIVSTWAPPSENNTASYISSVSTAMGKPPDLPLNAEDYLALINAMAQIESGPKAPKLGVPANTGAPAALPGLGGMPSTHVHAPIPANPAALGAARGAQPTPSLSAPPIASAGGARGGVSVAIDSMTVNTQASDAGGIAADMIAAVRRKAIVFQADSGVYA